MPAATAKIIFLPRQNASLIPTKYLPENRLYFVTVLHPG